MLPHELADDACSLRPDEDRLCVTVEIPPSGEPQFYRSVIRSNARLTYGQAQRREAPAEILAALDLNDEVARELRSRRFARGALQVQTPEVVFTFDGQGGVADAWLEGEPHAHMLVEELMILANEHVGGFLVRPEPRGALPRPRAPRPAGGRASAREAHRPRRADAAGPGAALAPAARRSSPARSRCASPSTPSSRGAGARRFPRSCCARSSRRATTRRTSATRASRARRTAHFTSPIRRYPDLVVHRALLRELGLADDPLPADLPALAEHTSEREREARAPSTSPTRSVSRGCSSAGSTSRLGRAVAGRDHRPDRLGPLRPLRRGLRGVSAGAAPARRVLRAERPRDRARRPHDGRAYRLGDPIEVRVESIARSEGKVELSLA